VLDRVGDPLTLIALRVTVPQLDRFVLTGRSPGGHRRTTSCPIVQNNVDLYGWMAARVDDLTRVDLGDLHGALLERIDL
jgi:hypothetical protein